MPDTPAPDQPETTVNVVAPGDWDSAVPRAVDPDQAPVSRFGEGS